MYNYSEKTYQLSGLNPLTKYLLNANGLDTQIPTLSSDTGQPLGIYYIDNSSNLDEMSLSTSQLLTVAHVMLLYQKFGYNEMLDNEFFIEYGSAMALLFGTRTVSSPTYSIELVNLTSRAVRIWNTSTATDSVNQEPLYLANNTVIVMSSNNSIIAYNLASHQLWKAGTLEFFESNNVYWLPQKQQLINVEAGGSTADQVEQLNATYDSLGHVHFASAATITVDRGVRFNWASGLAYNASANEIAFSAGYWRGDKAGSYTIQYGANGLITTNNEQRWPVFVGSTETNPTIVNGQRYVYTSDYVMGQPLNGTQYLFDPWNGSTMPTSHSFFWGSGNPCANSCFEDTYAPSVNYLIDINATRSLGVPFYHVVYAYHQDVYPSSLPPPAPTNLTESGVTANQVTLSWSQSSGGGIVNNTVYRFKGPDCLGSSSQIGTNGAVAGYVFPPGALAPGTSYSSRVTSWNATGQSLPSNCVNYTTESVYTLTFTEKGLPSKTRWEVTIGSVTHSSTLMTIKFREPNGTYSYQIGPISGYRTTESGVISVHGASVTLHVNFSKTKNPTGTTISSSSSKSTSNPGGGAAWQVPLLTGVRPAVIGVLAGQSFTMAPGVRMLSGQAPAHA